MIVTTDSLAGWYTLRGAARLLRVKEDTLLKRVHARRVPALKIGSTLLIRLSDVR